MAIKDRWVFRPDRGHRLTTQQLIEHEIVKEEDLLFLRATNRAAANTLLKAGSVWRIASIKEGRLRLLSHRLVGMDPSSEVRYLDFTEKTSSYKIVGIMEEQ